MRIAAVLVLAAALVMPAAAKEVVTDTAKDAASVAAKAPSKETTVADVFHSFGLFGTWAADCGRPPSPDNPHVSVTTPSAGLVLENNDVGPGYAANRYSVLSANRLSYSRLEVTVIFRPGDEGEERQTLVFEIRKGTRRTIYNRVDGGAVRVSNGVVLVHDGFTTLNPNGSSQVRPKASRYSSRTVANTASASAFTGNLSTVTSPVPVYSA